LDDGLCRLVGCVPRGSCIVWAYWATQIACRERTTGDGGCGAWRRLDDMNTRITAYCGTSSFTGHRSTVLSFQLKLTHILVQWLAPVYSRNGHPY
jgi:hypothetical protein